MLFTNLRRGSFAKDPAVVRFKGVYYLYYTIKYSDEPFMIGVGIARSTDMEAWDDIAELPHTDECEKKRHRRSRRDSAWRAGASFLSDVRERETGRHLPRRVG